MRRANETIHEELNPRATGEQQERQIRRFLERRCNDGRCWVLCCVFGQLRATPYRWPSSIPYYEIDAAWQFGRKYWRAGAWHEFPERARRKNDRAAYTGDR